MTKPHSPIFVYGTLMTGERAYDLHARYIDRSQEGILRNADLFSLGAYPMVVSGAGQVRGEAQWLLSEAYGKALARLDGYEGPEYTRELRCILLDGSETEIEAWVYVGKQEPHKPARIPDGDWRRWCKRQGM